MAGIRGAKHYHAQLRALLPAGPAWDPEWVPALEKILLAMAKEMARMDARAFDVINEMDPAGKFSLSSPFSGDLGKIFLPQLKLVAGQGKAEGHDAKGFDRGRGGHWICS